MAKRVVQSCFLLALLIVIISVPGKAQSTFGSFLGTVRDPSGSVVSAVKVTAVNKGTDAQRTTITDSSGSYDIVNLEPGTYQITMESPGFQRSVYPNLELDARQPSVSTQSFYWRRKPIL